MKNNKRFIRPVMIVLLMATRLFGIDKGSYDCDIPVVSVEGDVRVVTAAPKMAWPSGLAVQNDTLQATLLAGCYFTVGTVNGPDAGTPDDHCSMSFGHPYARTSYPMIGRDGVWYKPEETAVSGPELANNGSGSLSCGYLLQDSIRFSFVLVLENSDVVQSLRFVNLGTDTQVLQPALVFDPGMGKAGSDGYVWQQGSMVSGTEAKLAAPDTLLLTEKCAGQQGLRASLVYDPAQISYVECGNWDRMEQHCHNDYDVSDPGAVYDLCLRSVFQTVTIPPGDTVTVSCRLAAETGMFGILGFLRWDCPRQLTTESGMVFPQAFPARLNAFNPDVSPAAYTVRTHFPYEVTAADTVALDAAAPGMSTYGDVFVTVRENYAVDRIVPLALALEKDGQVIDTLYQNMFIPVTPYSDTGLTVTVESLVTDGYPDMSLVFSCQRTQTLQTIFSLGTENVQLYENGTPVSITGVGKDTSGIGELDIVFVLDVTGSMGNEIGEVKDNILQFADTLASRGVSYRLGMVTFLDEIENVYELTDNPLTFKSYLAEQYAHGGGDGPENSLDALYRASELQFRTGAKKMFIWITDNTYHEADAVTPRTAAQVTDRLLAGDITVHCIGTAYWQDDSYREIYDPTGGEFYDINGNFQDILLDIADLKYVKNMVISYRSAVPSDATSTVVLEIHYAGLGGSDTLTVNGPAAGAKAATEPLVTDIRVHPQGTSDVQVAFRVTEASRGLIEVCRLNGERVGVSQGTFGRGAQQRTISLQSVSAGMVRSGIYIVRLSFTSPGKHRNQLIIHKSTILN